MAPPLKPPVALLVTSWYALASDPRAPLCDGGVLDEQGRPDTCGCGRVWLTRGPGAVMGMMRLHVWATRQLSTE